MTPAGENEDTTQKILREKTSENPPNIHESNKKSIFKTFQTNYETPLRTTECALKVDNEVFIQGIMFITDNNICFINYQFISEKNSELVIDLSTLVMSKDGETTLLIESYMFKFYDTETVVEVETLLNKIKWWRDKSKHCVKESEGGDKDIIHLDFYKNKCQELEIEIDILQKQLLNESSLHNETKNDFYQFANDANKTIAELQVKVRSMVAIMSDRNSQNQSNQEDTKTISLKNLPPLSRLTPSLSLNLESNKSFYDKSETLKGTTNEKPIYNHKSNRVQEGSPSAYVKFHSKRNSLFEKPIPGVDKLSIKLHRKSGGHGYDSSDKKSNRIVHSHTNNVNTEKYNTMGASSLEKAIYLKPRKEQTNESIEKLKPRKEQSNESIEKLKPRKEQSIESIEKLKPRKEQSNETIEKLKIRKEQPNENPKSPNRNIYATVNSTSITTSSSNPLGISSNIEKSVSVKPRKEHSIENLEKAASLKSRKESNESPKSRKDQLNESPKSRKDQSNDSPKSRKDQLNESPKSPSRKSTAPTNNLTGSSNLDKSGSKTKIRKEQEKQQLESSSNSPVKLDIKKTTRKYDYPLSARNPETQPLSPKTQPKKSHSVKSMSNGLNRKETSGRKKKYRSSSLTHTEMDFYKSLSSREFYNDRDKEFETEIIINTFPDDMLRSLNTSSSIQNSDERKQQSTMTKILNWLPRTKTNRSLPETNTET